MILLVLSDDALRHNVGGVLTHRGYRVRLASSGAKALAILERAPIACAVIDDVLSDADGLALLHSLVAEHPAVPVIMVQGSPDTRAVIAARERGATEYLAGPLTPSALVAAIARGLGGEAPSVVPLEIGGMRARQSRRLAAAGLDALVWAMEAKDPHLAGHSIRVGDLAASIATRMGRIDREVEEVRLAGRLHDIGMIAISDGILTKPGRLSPEEYAEVKRHPVLGHQLLAAYPDMERVARYVRGHHERWDGMGYPDGLAGEAIPLGARIVAAAEIFDALTTSRSYRSAASVAEALERMQQISAEAVDPAVMRALQMVVWGRRTLEFIRDDDRIDVESTMLAGPVGNDLEHERAAS
jgi:HD-GYP domain-containing protein (c-di-GMP phosphodiesterase class II)